MWHSSNLNFQPPFSLQLYSELLSQSQVPHNMASGASRHPGKENAQAPCFDHLRPSNCWDVTQLDNLSAFILLHRHITANYVHPLFHFFFPPRLISMSLFNVKDKPANSPQTHVLVYIHQTAKTSHRGYGKQSDEYIFLCPAQCHPVHLTHTSFSNCFFRIIIVVLNTASLRINRKEALDLLSRDTNTDRFETQMKLSFHVITVLSQGFFTRHKTQGAIFKGPTGGQHCITMTSAHKLLERIRTETSTSNTHQQLNISCSVSFMSDCVWQCCSGLCQGKIMMRCKKGMD